MPPLVLTAVKIVSGSTTINAETPTELQFEFDRQLKVKESVQIRCHIHEPVFMVDYYLPDLTFNGPTDGLLLIGQTSPDTIPKKVFTASLTFPEELAGATIYMNFYLKSGVDDPSDISTQIVFGSTQPSATGTPDPISKTITIERKSGVPEIINVHWGENENIEYGVISTPRTATICKNELGYLHIHTRGLYGKTIKVMIPPYMEQDCKVKNNIYVKVLVISSYIPHLNTQLSGCAKLAGAISYLPAYTATLTLDKINDTPITPATTAVIASAGRDITPPLAGSTQCRVEFRPDTTYNGNFGFSWFRKGDLAAYGSNLMYHSRTLQDVNVNLPCNDQSFDKILGHHYNIEANTPPPAIRYVIQNVNDSSYYFDVDTQMVENHKLDYRKLLLWDFSGTEYLVPVMTLRNGEEAELRLFIEAGEEVMKLEFEFDNPLAISQGYLTITPSVIENIPVSPYGQSPHTIKVKCLKEFSKELMLRVKAYPKMERGIFNPLPDMCGAVRLLPNDISHQRHIKVVFFNVKTLLNSTLIDGIPSDSVSEIDTLKKILGQAYLVPDITVEDLNLSKEADTIYTGTFKFNPVPNSMIGISRSGNSLAYSPDKARINDLENFLDKKISQLFNTTYNDYYKIFFFGDYCKDNTGDGLNGFSSGSREKFTVIFAGAELATPTHELGHSLGLPHTFYGGTTKSKYVYQDGTTDNIMDYSHWLGVDRISFFHWQWRAINNNLP